MMKYNKRNILKASILSSFLALCFGLLASCGSSNASFNKAEYNELKQLVNSRNFKIENSWANPQGGSQINLIGNSNHIRFKRDSVEIFLPYFGVRHSGGGYGGEGGIKYEGPAKNLKITENSEKGNILVEFEGKQNNEILHFFLRLYSNGKTLTSINSSQRSTISYQGELGEISEDEVN